jgi:imidazolonepropionase-like amidohydrolase
MTTNAARLFGVEKERGTIQPGMAADLIATPVNPMHDINGLARYGASRSDINPFISSRTGPVYSGTRTRR